MLLRVVDFETTGGEGSQVIEVGTVDVTGNGRDWRVGAPRTLLLKPTEPVSPHARAVHHISDDELAMASTFSVEAVERFIKADGPPDVLVAHHCDFERSFLGDLALASWVCTVKAARKAWPQAPGHANQVLRYWLELPLDPRFALPAHRAGPDAFVTAHILVQLLQTETVGDLIEWTTQPAVVTFGRHRGKAWGEVPSDYLRWIAGEEGMDMHKCKLAETELARRDGRVSEAMATGDR
ncbi:MULTISPECIES: exonuclease domain-containing protein [unclassified Brevundimonas]|uniref:exonuclease domain-containing protein n=1 Tax=unclassified Brevundimonas TaxID=2622653 RepID=UPI000AD2554B|nr:MULTISPECIES: exonuclease domain-containing protein [unclassified Brevundimonas]